MGTYVRRIDSQPILVSRAVVGTFTLGTVYEGDVIVKNAVADSIFELSLVTGLKLISVAHFEHHSTAFAGRTEWLPILGTSGHFDGVGATLCECQFERSLPLQVAVSAFSLELHWGKSYLAIYAPYPYIVVAPISKDGVAHATLYPGGGNDASIISNGNVGRAGIAL